ncbi:MAG: helix-turn-helix transcriptional regulator [Alphaproteobacteria bacterium]|nr:helix-turn-helix transcriptional regulator [Alphaproteobacteria bacterium]
MKRSLTPDVCRAARSLLGWSRETLAERSSVAERTIIDFEREARRPLPRTLRDLEEAIAAAGVDLIVDGGKTVGLRWRPG